MRLHSVSVECLKLLNALAADLFIAVITQIVRRTAHHAVELTFAENDGIPVKENLEIVILVDVQTLAQLLGEHKPAK